MKPVNSVANCIFIITIVCSLCCLAFGSMYHQISFLNSANLSLNEMISTKISSSISLNDEAAQSSHIVLKDGELSFMEYGGKKQTVLINDEKKEFKDSVSMSDQQVPNKYFCNETSYSKICASINPNSYEINISDKNLEDNFQTTSISPNIKNKESHYQLDEMKKNDELKSMNLEKSPKLETALKLQLENFENYGKTRVVNATNQEKIKNINDNLEKEKVNTLANIKLLLSQFKNRELNNKLSQVNLDKKKMLSETSIETTDGPKFNECEYLKEKHLVELQKLQDEIIKLKNDKGKCMNEPRKFKKYAQQSKLWKLF